MKQKKLALKKDITTSPVPALFQSNRPPSDEEATKIRHAIARAEAEMERLCDLKILDENMAAPQQKVFESLLGQYAAFVAKHRGLLSPIRRLPMDILQLVFDQFKIENEGLALHHRRPPWVLSHVCRAWRVVALDMAVLWQHFPPIHVNSLKTRPARDMMVAALLVRSKTLPITFLLAYSEHENTILSNRLPVLYMLLEHSRRWARVYLRCSGFPTSIWTLLQAFGRFDALRALTLDVADLREHPETNGAVNVFSTAPLLREFSFIGTTALHSYAFLPPDRLTHYEANDVGDIYPVLVALRSAHTLHSLILRTHRRKHDASIAGRIHPLSEMTFPVLETLVLECFQTQDDEYLMALMRKLRVPDLRHLTVRYFAQNKITEALMTMLRESGCQLDSFVGHHRPDLLSAPEEFIPVPMCHRHTKWAFLNITFLRVNDPDEFMLEYVLCCADKAGQWAYLPSLERVVIDLTAQVYPGPVEKFFRDITKAARKRCAGVPGTSGATLVSDFEISAPISNQRWYAGIASGVSSNWEEWGEGLAGRCRAVYNALVRRFPSAPGIEPPDRKTYYTEIGSLITRVERLELDRRHIPSLYYMAMDYVLLRIVVDQQHWLSAVQLGILMRRIKDTVTQWTVALNSANQSQASANPFSYQWQWKSNGNLGFMMEDSESDSQVPPPTRFLSDVVDLSEKWIAGVASATDYHWVPGSFSM